MSDFVIGAPSLALAVHGGVIPQLLSSHGAAQASTGANQGNQGCYHLFALASFRAYVRIVFSGWLSHGGYVSLAPCARGGQGILVSGGIVFVTLAEES